MVGKTLKIFGARLGWYSTPDSVFGLYDGYLVTISQRLLFGVPKEESIRIDTVALDDATRLRLLAAIEEACIPIHGAKAQVSDRAISLTYRKLFTYRDRHQVAAVIDQLIGLARARGIGAHSVGLSSGTGLHYCILEGTGVVLDEDEYRRLKGREDLANGLVLTDDRSYRRGLTGAAVFGFLGLLAVGLKAYVFEPFPSFGGALIGFLCVRGYQRFDGHVGDRTRTALLSLAIMITVLGSLTALAANAYAGGTAVTGVVEQVIDRGLLAQHLLRDTLVAILFAGGMCFIMIRLMRQRTASGVTDAVPL